MSYSVSTTPKAPNVAVSTASTPTSKNSEWSCAIRSGRLRARISLHPSRSGPPKSSGERSRSWTQVPKAPSKMTTRSSRVRRKSDIPWSGYRRVRFRLDPFSGDTHRSVGAREQRSVAAAVAVGPHERGLVAEPRVEAPDLLAATDVPAVEASGADALVDLDLGREHRVEAQLAADRRDVGHERRRHDHQRVTLPTVPPGTGDDVRSEVAHHDSGRELLADALDLGRGAPRERVPDHDRLRPVAASREERGHGRGQRPVDLGAVSYT